MSQEWGTQVSSASVADEPLSEAEYQRLATLLEQARESGEAK